MRGGGAACADETRAAGGVSGARGEVVVCRRDEA